ncbi:hypothetical protein ACHAQH_008408 [Verticillium albo-atrum]
MSSQPSQARKIAIVGGSGQVGTPTIASLLKRNIHTITAISRPESTAKFPKGVVVKKGSYDNDAFLVSTLQGQDILVLQLSIDAMATQEAFIRAAAKAGVPRVLTTEFGSDIAEPKLTAMPIMAGKLKYRALVEELGMKWIAVVNNPWIDMTLPMGAWGLDLKNRKATLYDGGNTKTITTTVATTGKGTAGLLSLPEQELREYDNGALYLKSFRVSQRDLLESVLRVTGATEADWEIKNEDAGLATKRLEEVMAGGDHSVGMLVFFIMHMREGYGGDYDEKVGDLARLGIEPEDLDLVTEQAVDKALSQ